MTNKRHPILAAILSLLLLGLGHMYAGNIRKGLVLIAVEYSAFVIIDKFDILSTFNGMVAFIVVSLSFYIYVLVSSVMLAHKNKEYQPKPYNRWYFYLLAFITMSILSGILHPYHGEFAGYKTYRIPSSNMLPTLQNRDYITVNTRYPQPEIGDVVVFLYPKDRSIPHVNRIAALGNDTVAIRNGIVIRNGQTENRLGVIEKNRQRDFSISMTERRIKENEIFLLGDNRDNSNDSRFRGTVLASDVIGKVNYIWFSANTDRIGKTVE